MSFGLPESFVHVCEISFASLYAKLIERGKYTNCPYLSLCFPKGFDGCVKILTNSIRTGIPEPYLLGEMKGKRVVGERKRSVKETEEIAEMDQTMSHIIRSSECGYLHMIPCEHLARLKDHSISQSIIISKISINLFQIQSRNPRISIYDRQNDFFRVYFIWNQEILLNMLCTPTDIRSFSFLLKLSHLMSGKFD